MLIAQISDTHILAPMSDHPSVQLRADWLRRCVADINKQQVDAVIFTGDTVQTGHADEYALLHELLAPLQSPLYLVPGNRDNNKELCSTFNENSSLLGSGQFLHYVVDDYPVRLIAIDSTDYGERKGVFCTERQSWLEAMLSEQPNRPTLLFIHHPPFDVDDHYVGGYRRPEDAQALTDIVRRNKQVKGLVCGHVHCPVDYEWAGTRAKVMPSVAVDLRKGIDETNAQERPIYYLHRLGDEIGFVTRPRMVD